MTPSASAILSNRPVAWIGAATLVTAILAASCVSHRRVVARHGAPPPPTAAAADVPSPPPVAPTPAHPVAIASGSNHVCARISDDSVVCWGDDAMGQTGEASFVTHAAPAHVAGLGDVKELALGSEHTCARLGDGSVRCWGGNDLGQLGDGTTARSAAPRTVIGVSGAVHIAAGAAHSCAIRDAGEVSCWGFDGGRALGEAARPRGDAVTRATEVVGVHDAVELALGDGHSCARRTDGSLACWGTRSAGVAELAKDSPAVAIAAFGGRTCAARADGTVACFDVFTRATEHVDVAAVLGAPAVSIVLGFEMACARSAEGVVACWGKNDWGQLGDGATRSHTDPVRVSGISPASQIAVGAGHACALERDGDRIRCWGSNASGELGRDPHIATSDPASVASLQSARAVALGRDRSCAITETHGVSCWGAIAPFGAPNPASVELRPTPLAGAADVAALALGGGGGESFLCLATSDGKARCLGANELGQLGDGTREPRVELGDVEDLEDVVELAAGQRHACARTKSGAVACWGQGTRGGPREAGASTKSKASRGSKTSKASKGNKKAKREHHVEVVPIDRPHFVRGVSNAASITAGVDFTCARLRDGTARCWGSNRFGQLGDGTQEPREGPVRVRDLGGIDELVAGDAHVCARLHDGTVKCWGNGTSGQLGSDGDAVSRPIPTKVRELSDAAHIAAGGLATCALLRDGSAYCWGKLPDLAGPPGFTRSPTAIHGIEKALFVSVGGEHACAIDDRGLTRCWGGNEFGELGDGQRLLFSAEPLPIAW